MEEVHEDVIRLFYIDDLSWSEVIEQVNYKRTQCHKIRTEAIEELILKLLEIRTKYEQLVNIVRTQLD